MRASVAFLTSIAAIAIPVSAQSQRRAALVGGGDRDRGKCTVEVVVDGAADVEIRGDMANIRTLSGQPAQWRRFQCTGPVPANPVDFRLEGVDGRGRQQLVRDPRNGGSAVVRIEDSQGGAEGYTFDITWGGGSLSGDPRWYDEGTYRPPAGAYDNRDRVDRRYSTQQAIDLCQDAVRQEASRRFGARDVEFRGAQLDDNPGRHGWITGRVDVRRGGDRGDSYQFSCSVNFDNGQVRSVRLDPFSGDGVYYGSHDREDTSTSMALERCQGAVQDRIRQSGYNYVDFGSIRIGRGDLVVGQARADRGNGRYDNFEFSCSVNRENGNLRDVDVRRQ